MIVDLFELWCEYDANLSMNTLDVEPMEVGQLRPPHVVGVLWFVYVPRAGALDSVRFTGMRTEATPVPKESF